MMYEEFEKIAGYKVSYEDYVNVIEPMYTATNLSKTEFVKVIDRKRFEVVEKTERQYINEIKKIAKVMFEKCGHVTTHEEEAEIIRITREMERKFYCEYVPVNGYEYENYRGCHYIQKIVKYVGNKAVKEFTVA